MDQIRIGKFIAQQRKEKGLTQLQLADLLSIRDKTVSKWERGRGLPDVSLMIPLCEVLDISVNDLLTATKVSERDYQKNAEENMLHLMEENQANQRLFFVSLICGLLTIIAGCSLIFIASLMKMPTIVRILVILFAGMILVLGISATIVLDIHAGYYECPHCHAQFVPTVRAYIKGYHTMTKRRLKCPICHKIGMCKKRIQKKKN